MCMAMKLRMVKRYVHIIVQLQRPVMVRNNHAFFQDFVHLTKEMRVQTELSENNEFKLVIQIAYGTILTVLRFKKRRSELQDIIR